MSFPPGVPLSMARPFFATTTVPSGPMMLQVAPARQVAMVPLMQPVMRPVISQAQHTFVSAMRPRPLPQMIANSARIVHQGTQQIWFQAPDIQTAVLSKQLEESREIKEATIPQPDIEQPTDPAITVFVGNITDRASDTLVRQILMKCGSVYSWKRVQGTSGKLQAFGFCEYRNPESALRAIHVLHDYTLGDKKLLVKVDAKTQNLIDKWKTTKGIIETGTDGDAQCKPPGVEEALAGIQLLIQEYSTELNAPKPHQEKEELPVLQLHKPDLSVRDSQNVEQNLQELELEEEQKNFISKEIRTFRESQKLQEKKKKSENIRKDVSLTRDQESRKFSRVTNHERNDRERLHVVSTIRRSRTPSPRRERRRSRSPVRRRRSRTPRRSPVRRSGRRSRSPVRRKRSSSRSPDSWHRDDDDDSVDEVYERRRLERKIRGKEAAYQQRLRDFEARERRMKKNYEKQDEREQLNREEMMKKAKCLQEFLADYEDEQDDVKYYSGNSLTKRLQEREQEIEMDDKDRKKEKEEIGLFYKHLIDKNHPDPDGAIKFITNVDGIWKPLIEPDTPGSNVSSNTSSDEDSGSADSEEDSDSSESDSEEPIRRGTKLVQSLKPIDEEVTRTHLPVEKNKQSAVKSAFNMRPLPHFSPILSKSASDFPQRVMRTAKSKTGVKTNPRTNGRIFNSKRHKLNVSNIFKQEDDGEEISQRRKLVPLQYSDEEHKALNPANAAEDERKSAEKKRRLVRALIERIPTHKHDLFDYKLDWSLVNSTLMEKRIQPWISKKIIEYIGEEEPTLVEFICSKILTKSTPEKILEDISMVLDEEADVFVVKMWRLLIYETEAKREGITK